MKQVGRRLALLLLAAWCLLLAAGCADISIQGGDISYSTYAEVPDFSGEPYVILNDNQPVPVTVERIIAEVARTCSVTPQDIRSTKRAAQISTARQAAVYIVRDITQMSMSAIGTEFGGRDHSTIVYAIQQVEAKMQDNPKYRAMIEDIIKNIRDS